MRTQPVRTIAAILLAIGVSTGGAAYANTADPAGPCVNAACERGSLDVDTALIADGLTNR